ncbi:hypothetical protein [Streptomyces sp. NBC_01618]|uniref:hypothetical protein n=1 Tax=Streptomyces sp. NBC_01618 TaxID=2975900 RepID=UPI00386889E4|nr:hypothetical protein OH735_31565 [Streptomyces sp. NBC_01618]
MQKNSRPSEGPSGIDHQCRLPLSSAPSAATWSTFRPGSPAQRDASPCTCHTNREGSAPDRGLVVAMGLDNDYYQTFQTSGLGSLELRVPQGTYALFGGLTTGDLTKVAGAKVSVSYDGGKTWRPATVERADADSFGVSYRQPKLSETNGYVAVKAELWDNAGSRTVETLDQAYTLK